MDYYYPVTSNTYTAYTTPTISWTTSTTASPIVYYNGTYYTNTRKEHLTNWLKEQTKEPCISEDDLLKLIEGDK